MHGELMTKDRGGKYTKSSSGQQPFFFIGFCANHIINLSNLNHIDYYRSTWLQIRFVTYWAGTI